RDLHAGLLHRRPGQPGRHMGRARQPAPRLLGQPGRAVLVHRRVTRARPRRQPPARRGPDGCLRDGGDHRRRRLLLHAARRRGTPRVEAGRIQAGPSAVTLDADTIAQLAAELAEAERTRGVIPRITARHPEATIEDAYAIQGIWRDAQLAAGRTLVGRKIGLTSKAMQQATGITEPDYGVMFDDTVYASGADIPFDHFSNVRIEVELAFVLSAPLSGPDCTLENVLAGTSHVVPALEVLNSHIELEGRTIVDTISDNAAYGAMV